MKRPFYAPLSGEARVLNRTEVGRRGRGDHGLEKELKLMEEVTKLSKEAHGEEKGDPDASFLREILLEQDPHAQRYGLRKVLTKENHIFWVCNDHYSQHEDNGQFKPL